jgi:hypothetical protein
VMRGGDAVCVRSLLVKFSGSLIRVFCHLYPPIPSLTVTLRPVHVYVERDTCYLHGPWFHTLRRILSGSF